MPTDIAISSQPERSQLRYAANLKWLFNELPFLDRFTAAAAQGFEAVEFASPYEYAPSVLRDALTRNGLNQVLINTPASAPGNQGENGFACIPGQRRAFREGLTKAIDYATALDCRLIHVMAGRLLDPAHSSVADATFRENIAWAVDATKGTGIRCVLECLNQVDVPGYYLQSLSHTVSLIEELSNNALGLLFDVYHCRVSDSDILDAYRQYRPLIAHVQFADVPGRHEPGTGDIPWYELRELMESNGYTGWVGCEYRPQVSTIDGLKWRTECEGLL